MTKKILSLILAAALILSALAGCNGNTTPEPEPTPPHEHLWTDATHQKPKTCSVCGETEGEPVPHEWKEANYQEPKNCTECDATEGEAISPIFPVLGFELSEIGVAHIYKSCYEDKSDATSKATVKNVRVISGDDYYEPKEDCEWIIATCIVEVAENPKVFQIGIERTDFYCYDLNTVFPTRTVNYYGADREIENKTKMLQSTSTIMEFEVGYLVPVGYDGVMFAFFNDYNNMIIDYSNPDTVVTFEDILDGDTLFFRLKK
jgi:hypothetical protein